MQIARGWQSHRTWGDAINARIKAQGPKFSAQNPYGSFDSPRVTGRPK
jgi:filamentous hemagglutinin